MVGLESYPPFIPPPLELQGHVVASAFISHPSPASLCGVLGGYMPGALYQKRRELLIRISFILFR